MTIRVLIADDQALVRAGIRMLVETQPDLEVVGEAEDGIAAVSEVTRSRPDVVLMDVRMPRMDGLEAARRIAALGPDPAKVVMLTTFDIDEYVFDALSSGATGFLLKHARPEELLFGIRAAADGHALVAPVLTRRLIERFARGRPRAAPELDRLTEREREVLILLVRGLSNAEIASRLVVGESTVKTHVARVFTKLRLRDRAQAVIFGYETGLVTPARPEELHACDSRRGPGPQPMRGRRDGVIMGAVDDSHYSLVIAAAQAAGPCPPGGEAAWGRRVHGLTVDLHLIAQQARQDIERLESAKTFIAFLEKVEIEESSRRGLLTLRLPSGEREPIRTEQKDTDRGHALIERARSLEGRWVLVYRYNERKTGQRNQSVRMLAHLMDLGVDGAVPSTAAKKMVLQEAGGDVARAQQAWAATGLPGSGPVGVDQLEQARAAARDGG